MGDHELMPLLPQDRKPLFRAADARHKTDFTTAWVPLPEELFGALIEEVRFALESPLEGDGWEPSVPAGAAFFETAPEPGE